MAKEEIVDTHAFCEEEEETAETLSQNFTPSRPIDRLFQSPIYPMTLVKSFVPMMPMTPFIPPNPLIHLQLQAMPPINLPPVTAVFNPMLLLNPFIWPTPRVEMGISPSTSSPMSPEIAVQSETSGGKCEPKERIKKPRNAFFIFKAEHRLKLLENPDNARLMPADLNKELGRVWATMRDTGEQQKYIELANKEREAHKEKYPGWRASGNYGSRKMKPAGERKRLDMTIKRCRARFGVDNSTIWCAPCLRKKRCIYATADDDVTSSSSSSSPSESATSSSTSTPDTFFQEDVEEDVKVTDLITSP